MSPNLRSRGLLCLLLSAVLASGQKHKKTIVDLTDQIRVGIVEETIGDAAMKQLNIDEVSMAPEMSFAKTTGRSTRVCLSTQIGTHMDAGAHADPDGWPVNEVLLDRLIVPGVVVDARDKTENEGVTVADLKKYNIEPGDAVLILFKYATPKSGEMFSQAFLTDEGAQWLADHKVSCVGSNTPGLEDHKRGEQNHWMDPHNQKIAWPVHKILLHQKIPIIEGLTNLDKLVGKKFEFVALPLKIDGADGAPVRAVAVLE